MKEAEKLTKSLGGTKLECNAARKKDAPPQHGAVLMQAYKEPSASTLEVYRESALLPSLPLSFWT